MKKLKLNLKPMVTKLEVFTKKDTMSELSGSYVSFFLGKGLDFEGYREYTLHDDAKNIDWKASLRSKGLVMRLMKDERNIKVFFVFDVSDSMLFGSIDKLKCEYGAEVIASLCFAILRAGDSVGLVMFSDKIVKILDAKSGFKHYYDITRTLSDPRLYGGRFDFAKVLKFLNSYIPRNSIVILVSDYIGLDNKWVPHFEVAVEKFNFLLVIMVRDPVDNKLPRDKGQISVEDPFSPRKIIIDPDLLGKAYDESARRIKEKIKSEFSKLRCETVELQTNEAYEKLLVKFFVSGKKKWR